ncbi:Regulator of G-protein signaling 5 [Coelomomyces lativittatus]|nr:Regulator of G-protein signaling 5 [Coelomomyces lativittatus]
MFDQRITFSALMKGELNGPLTLANFENFLRTKEHSEENLEFLRAAEKYRKSHSEIISKLKEDLKNLISVYLETGAPHEINCPNKVRAKVLNDFKNEGQWDPSILEPVEEKIFELMRLSSFPHFLRHVEESLDQSSTDS